MGVLYIGVSQVISSDYFSRVRKKTTVEEKVLAIIFRNGLRRTITLQIFYFSQVRPLAKYDSSASERESCEARWLLEAQKISCEDTLGLIQQLDLNLSKLTLFDPMAINQQDFYKQQTWKISQNGLFFFSLSRELHSIFPFIIKISILHQKLGSCSCWIIEVARKHHLFKVARIVDLTRKSQGKLAEVRASLYLCLLTEL